MEDYRRKQKKKVEKKKFEKVEKKIEKQLFLKSVGDALGVFLEYQRVQKNYIEVVTTKKKISE